jgi:NAD(P)-dependent dehydrogenase (short-subunit alcohol dehydrogenase family)
VDLGLHDRVVLVGRILERWDRLDVLVNNAGAGECHAVVALDGEAWQASAELNLLAAVRLIRAAIRALRAGGQGTIVNAAAAAGKRPRLGQSVSNITKAAPINLTGSLPVELAPDGIRVNAVCPGFVLNDRWVGRITEVAARRAVPPAELAAPVARDNVPRAGWGPRWTSRRWWSSSSRR